MMRKMLLILYHIYYKLYMKIAQSLSSSYRFNDPNEMAFDIVNCEIKYGIITSKR